MKTYGEVIRDIRLNKGLKQKDVYHEIISKSYAIDFEKGNHDISLRLMEQIVQRLMISLDEFLFIYRGYQPSEIEQFLLAYSTAGNKNDSESLQKLMHTFSGKEDIYSKLRLSEIRSRFLQLEEFNQTGNYTKNSIRVSDQTFITSYLSSLQSWTLHEILLFANTIDFINYEEKADYFQLILPLLDKYKHYDRGKLAICGLLTNVIHELILAKESKLAREVLERLNDLASEYTEIFFKIVYLYYSGLLLIIEHHRDAGEKKAQRGIEMLYELQQPHQAKLFEAIVRELVIKMESKS
ncbi:Rgg family transcriptional regulator [Carnobacterium gallinarum]|uniref:helix-turn-helix domain-containing protein n=1 Tax=Carnobacterium gallinarum TaxID=2749 RepID=UPI00068D765E|nr:Rgg/GadR/MutR family transcriptional regulator [Carnobacterium gallinarum]